jgi:uncharacterized protein with PIN domain
MECVKCKAPVTQEEMDARREKMWKESGIIARIVPMCQKCRDMGWTKTPIIKRVG